MKHRNSKLLFISIVTFTFLFIFTTTAFAGSYGINVPSTVTAGKTFSLMLYGSGSNDWYLYTGRTDIVPSSWEISTSNQYLYDVFFNFESEDIIYPHTTTLKILMPGTWTLKTVFCPATYDFNGGFDFWDENTNNPILLNKSIKVRGTVKFNPRKGKISSSGKTKLLSQNAKVGKLPKTSRHGHRFLGWYTKASGGKKISSTSKVHFSGATKTYYAHWR